MNTVTNTSTEEVTSTAAPEAPEAAPAPEMTAEAPAKGAESAVVPQAPQYQPNYKFKVMDREHEIPEGFRSIIKDAETEKQVREIFEKATGIDHVKSERTQLRDEFRNYRSQSEPIMKLAQEFNHYRQTGNTGAALQVLGLSKQEVLRWAVQEVQKEELSPEQKRLYDEREAQARSQYARDQQLAEMQSQFQALQVQQRQTELSHALSRPDVASFVSQFDQRNGQDAFKNEVIARGKMYWFSYNRDVPPDQIVGEIMQKFGAQQAMSGPQAAPTTTAPRAQGKVPVIPNTGASGSSPAQRSIRSLDDLKKIAREKFAE